MNFSQLVSGDGLFSDGDWIEKKDQDINGRVRLIQLADIGDGYFKDKSSRYVTEDTASRLNCTFLEQGDILIARLPDPLGRACIFPLKGQYITAVDIAILRIKNRLYNPRYIMYLINSPQFRKSISCYESGTTRKRISRRNLDKIQFNVPDITVQERIVSKIEELFSKLDASVAELKTAKEKLKVYRQAVLKEAFTGLSNKRPIREMTSIVTSGSRGWAKYYSNSGAKFIRIGNLTRDSIKIDLSEPQYVSPPVNAEGARTKLQPNDVLVSITADLGSIGLVTEVVGEAYINQHIALVRFKNSEQSEFMAWYLRSDWGQKDLLKNKRGAGKLGLGLNDIRDAKVPVVSDEQAKTIVFEISGRLSVCDSIEQTVDTSLQKAEALRQSILKQAFEGRLL